MEKENEPPARRLVSLDALRGFDMFWIMGGENIFALSQLSPAGPFLNGVHTISNMLNGTDFFFTI
jgi:hypothetical protein